MEGTPSTSPAPKKVSIQRRSAAAAAADSAVPSAEVTRNIAGYASTTSVFPGEAIDFHVSNEQGQFRIDIHRKGVQDQFVLQMQASAEALTKPANAPENGCGWPVANNGRLVIPSDWKSGLYVATLSTMFGLSTEIPFVVKSARPGTTARILFQFAVNTYQAYNPWGGRSLYGHEVNGQFIWFENRAFQVSLDRPYAALNEMKYYELPFVQWLESNGIAVDFCTSIDVHAAPELLDRYQLLVCTGHDEYWSQEMRENVDAFVANGGNVAIFGGNTCWFQVRFENNNRTMVCYKDAALDPVSDTDPARATVNWTSPPVNNPENTTIGVSYLNGAAWTSGNRPLVGYRVRLPEHWVFAGTGLKAGDEFGKGDNPDNNVVGYETDAALISEVGGIPEVTGQDSTPGNFVVLATADLFNWGPNGWSGPQQPGKQFGDSGRATMGLFRRSGTVFNAATVSWSRGLSPKGQWNAVDQITQNVLQRLSAPNPYSLPIANAGFSRWTDEQHPARWLVEGQGSVRHEVAINPAGQHSVRIDATVGDAWISQTLPPCEGRNFYRVSGWALSNLPGAIICLQSTATWHDFAIAEHSGSGEWEYLSAVGRIDNEGPLFPARLKLLVFAGRLANFVDVSVQAL